MTAAYDQLYIGLALAIVLIYFLIVVNFQSWLDPFVIITALPAALAGIVWFLFVTHTTLSVPALTGAIMCMGVATANSILVVSFCREKLAEGLSPLDAAIEAGYTRFRPVLMTALAMIIGMGPMALSAEQNAPLGRAVIGGLLCATIATLLFVPVVFRMVHEREYKNEQDDDEPASGAVPSPGLKRGTLRTMTSPSPDNVPPARDTAPRKKPKVVRYLLVAVLVFGALAVMGHHRSPRQRGRPHEMDRPARRHQRRSRVVAPRHRGRESDAAGERRGLLHGADPFARQRLREDVVFRHRRAR